jgi:erythromycin esterase
MSVDRLNRAGFLQWASESLAPLSTVTSNADRKDLAPLSEKIGDASIVALSEASHAAAEPLEFRNRVLQYLVEEKGFTAIAIESGLVEGRIVHDYVRGGAGEIAAVLAQGISWSFDRHPQNRDLVRWLRSYNSDPRRARKVNFYGFDVPGSPGNADARRSEDTALVELLRYLNGVDPSAAARFHQTMDAFLPDIRLDCSYATDGPRYTRLKQPDRDALTAAIADLVSLIERKEAEYSAASSADDYEWAYRAAIGARQIDGWLRHVPTGWQPSGAQFKYSEEESRFFCAALDTRDRAQADNLDWIVRREGPDGKVLVYASRFHISASTFKLSSSQQQTAGTYLRTRFGDRLVTIGNLIGEGECGDGEDGRVAIGRAGPDTIDGVAGELGVPLFLLDLRTAPAPVARWLAQDHPLAAGQEGSRLAIGRAFDVLFYIDKVTPA